MYIFRDAESAKTPLDSRIRPPHEPTFSSNVQGLLRTKVEGGNNAKHVNNLLYNLNYLLWHLGC